MIKRYLCGLLVITLLLCQPIHIIAEEIIPPAESADPDPRPTEEMVEEDVGEVIPQTEGADNNPRPETDEEDIVSTTDEPFITKLLISEVMIGSEVNPEKDSWVELYNPTSQSIDLIGWQIRGITKGGRWIDIAKESQAVESDGYFLFSYYSNSRYSALDIKPDITKDSLYFMEGLIEIELKNPDGGIGDQMSVEHLLSDEFQSYERNDNGEWNRSTEQINIKEGLLKTFATPGVENGDHQTNEEKSDEFVPPEAQDNNPEPPTSIQPMAEVVPIEFSYPSYQLISEVMVNPEGSDTAGEWIELNNSTKGPIDITGWYLDDAEGGSTPYWIRDKTVLMPDEYRLFEAPGLNLSLKNSEDDVRLLDPNGEPKEVIRYSDAKENWTYAKRLDGGFEWTKSISPGEENQFPPPPKAYPVDAIIIQNVLPNPDGKDDGDETITLKNNLNESIALEGWTLVNQKGKPYALDGMVMGAYEKKTADPSDFGLTMTNTSDQISLMDPMGNLIDRINWTDAKSGQLIFRTNYFRDGMNARVLKIIDGDTLEVEIDNESFKIRLIGVDTPETVHPFLEEEEFGKEASDYLKNLLANQTVVLEFDETTMDTYNRLLAYVYLRGIFINAEIIKNGFGEAYTDYPFRYLDEFVQYEQSAKEKRLGLWVYETSDPTPEGEDINPRPENDEINAENTVKLVIDESVANEEENDETGLKEDVVCPNEGLKIDAILPNPEKGETMEWVRISNPTDQKICLSGWQIDDDLVKGSRPFLIEGGAIAPGGMRTFRKAEIGIALNNSDDCANLLNPLNEVADRICYGKTHKNEVFTHDGGSWEPEPKKTKASASNRVPASSKVNQDVANYQWELKNETLEGEIAFIYEEGEVLYIKNQDQIIQVSYASSPVDMSMAKQLIDIQQPVTLHVRASEFEKQLIGLEQKKISQQPKKDNYPIELKYLLGLMVMSGGWYGLRKHFDKPFKKRTIIS
ncbi:lamin tail domain-containing protein [Patescibacteria group bacterium]|nr:lamin tail domain-containing protein [Patescibacteria group bacterium]